MATVTNSFTAQLVVFLDSTGNLHCEAPGQNGSRQKIDLPFDFARRNPELLGELQTQLDTIRARQAAKLRDMQNQNIQYVAQTPGMGIDFAKKIWPKDQIAMSKLNFSRAAKRLHNTSVVAAVDKTQPKKRAKKLNHALAIDL